MKGGPLIPGPLSLLLIGTKSSIILQLLQRFTGNRRLPARSCSNQLRGQIPKFCSDFRRVQFAQSVAGLYLSSNRQ